jgi:hypothetical protein
MKEIIYNSGLMTCRHNEMQIALIDLFTAIKKAGGLPSDFNSFAAQVIDTVSERCENKDIIDSYKLFLLNKVKLAYEVANLTEIVQSDQSDDVLDIPIEEFEDAYTDHDFLKLVGYNE